ncbi:MAG: hypothetical protein GXY64_05030 [Bacteroidales bacterium]|nr:hypothetical protein [Bacteroidales bacterium]
MKKILFVALIAILLLSCGGSKEVIQSVPVMGRTVDTVRVTNIKFDSIYIDRWHDVDRSRDTVHIRDRIRELSYHVVHDTLHHVERDTIPVVRTVEVTKAQPYIPTHIKVLATIGIVAVLWMTCKIARRSI